MNIQHKTTVQARVPVVLAQHFSMYLCQAATQIKSAFHQLRNLNTVAPSAKKFNS